MQQSVVKVNWQSQDIVAYVHRCRLESVVGYRDPTDGRCRLNKISVALVFNLKELDTPCNTGI